MLKEPKIDNIVGEVNKLFDEAEKELNKRIDTTLNYLSNRTYC